MALIPQKATVEEEIPEPSLDETSMASTQAYVQDDPMSSGRTIPLSTPEQFKVETGLEADGPTDEGYHTNYDAHATSIQSGILRNTRGRQRSATLLDSNGTLDLLAKDVKKLVQGIQDLRHLGIEDLVLPLPKIVVVGDQSTGKSSLIEGISEIKVPRSAGCCTRCPLEINLSGTKTADDAWKCNVYLRTKYHYDSKLSGVNRNLPLGPWLLAKEPLDSHFFTVTAKDEVESVLYRAQLATLNPSCDPQSFIPGLDADDLPRSQEVKFSPNVVRLDISGPSLPNLSFYDLPGVINVAEKEDERYLVKLVRNLVKEYIRADNCINLLALPMTDDAANSSAAGIIKEARAEKRTVGVLTKPDRVQKGESLDQWISILSGNLFKLGFGYHVVKNNPDPRVGHVVARKEEVEFFETTEPYKTKLSNYKNRFGTVNLQATLSQKLTAQILTSLPRITEQVHNKAEAVNLQLRKLPAPLAGNLQVIVISKILDFSREIQRQIDATSPEYPFQKLWRGLASDFRKSIAMSRPVLTLESMPIPLRIEREASQDVFVADIPGTPTPSRDQSSPIVIESEDEAPCKQISNTNRSGNKKRPSAATLQLSAQKRTKIFDIPQYKGENDSSQSRKAYGPAKIFNLKAVQEIRMAAYQGGLPGQIDPRAAERMSTLSVKHWEEMSGDFLNRTEKLCKQVIDGRINDVFGPFKETQVYIQVVKICCDFLAGIMQEQRKAVTRLYCLEHDKPMTLDEEAMGLAKAKALAELQKRRHDNRATIYLSRQEAATAKVLTDQARQVQISKVTDEQMGTDRYSQEISMMADVRAYYQCAYSRFVDNVCQGIQGELFMKCRNDLEGTITRGLGLHDPDANERCALLLAVDPRTEETRAQLKKEQETLKKAQEWLSSLAKDAPVDEEDGNEDAEME